MDQENSLQVFAEAIIGGFDMKRKTASMQPKVETLELPSENTERLNSLAKALIKEAIVNNKARKDMYELIDELWNETFLEVYPLEEESDEEKTFREKAKIFLKKNEDQFKTYFNNMPIDLQNVKLPAQLKRSLYNKGSFVKRYDCWDGVQAIKPSIEIETSIVLEVICAINKAFSKYDHISEKHIVEIAVKRMNSIYVEQRRSQAVYVRLVLNWLVIYFRGNRSSKECKEFISQFDCESKFEEILCKLIFEISNC